MGFYITHFYDTNRITNISYYVLGWAAFSEPPALYLVKNMTPKVLGPQWQEIVQLALVI